MSDEADPAAEESGPEASHAAQAFGSGVRTTLRNNASAYGYSVTITAAFGLLSSSRAQTATALQTVLFAAGAAAAFLLVEVVASRRFHRLAHGEADSVVMISGAVDVLSILAAVGAGVALSRLPATVAWPSTAFGVTLVYLLVGGLDVLLARRMARRAPSA